MQIKNPTKEKIEGVQIGTNIYSIESEGTLNNVPEEDARYWQENLHKFLVLRKDKLEDSKEVVSQETIVEIPTPKVEEVIKDTKEEEIVPEVIEEEVKVVKVKGKNK